MMMNPVSLILLGKFSIRIIAEKVGIILQSHLLEGDFFPQYCLKTS